MDLLNHQRELVESTWSTPGFCILDEAGTGKTVEAFATADKLRRADKIRGMLVIAPNMVHAQWVRDELPKWGWLGYVYNCSSAGSQAASRACLRFLECSNMMTTLAMTYDALLTTNGRQMAERYLVGRLCLLVVDESQRVKNPQAQRTKKLLALAKCTPYRRIMTGTPVANSPFDIYTQVEIACPGYWKSVGIGSYWAFRTKFGVFEKGYTRTGGGPPRTFQQLKGYQNLAELNALLKPISRRVLKSEVLDLPPVVYTTRTFDLHKVQKEHYNTLRDTFVREVEHGIITAPLALTRLLRLQQIASGFVTLDDFDTLCPIEHNPRFDLLRELTADSCKPTIIWTKFTYSTDKIMELLGERAVRYDGKTSKKERTAAIQAFNAGEKQFFVSKASCGGVGLNLQVADTMIFYEKGFSSEEYLQAIARAERYGQAKSLEVINLVANTTVDERINQALSAKQELSEQVLNVSRILDFICTPPF